MENIKIYLKYFVINLAKSVLNYFGEGATISSKNVFQTDETDGDEHMFI